MASPYGIADMARDVLAVMDAEAIDRAHFVGRSIGGLVAQQLAILNPDRVSSLSLIMAMSRSMADIIPNAVLDRLMAEHIPDEDAYVARQLGVAQANGLAEDFRRPRETRSADRLRHGFTAGERRDISRQPCFNDFAGWAASACRL